MYQVATAVPQVAGSHRQAALVLREVIAYAEGPVGPEIWGWFDLPNGDTRPMTLPASAIDIYTIHEEN